jgi:outer membrane protein assembly factor BamD (BamD/ComL family)
MGGKHSWKRQHVFLYITCWLSVWFVIAGCAQSHNPDEGRIRLHTPDEEEQLVVQAKSSFAKSDFTTSVTRWREILERFPDTQGDKALYAMGLTYAFAEYPDANYDTSLNLFKMLIKQYPESVYITQAKIWISILERTIEKEKEVEEKNRKTELLENQLKAEETKTRQLLNQIKSLKEIDLGIEEKKRNSLPKNIQ